MDAARRRGTDARAIVATGAPDPDANAARRRASPVCASSRRLRAASRSKPLHAFCERLLHMFPFEANVPAHFEVIEEAERDEMIAAARQATSQPGDTRHGRPARGSAGCWRRETSEGGFDKPRPRSLEQRRDHHAPPGSFSYAAALARSARARGGRFGGGRRSRNAPWRHRILREWSAMARRLVEAGGNARRASGWPRRPASPSAGATLDAYLQVFLTREMAPRADTISCIKSSHRRAGFWQSSSMPNAKQHHPRRCIEKRKSARAHGAQRRAGGARRCDLRRLFPA